MLTRHSPPQFYERDDRGPPEEGPVRFLQPTLGTTLTNGFTLQGLNLQLGIGAPDIRLGSEADVTSLLLDVCLISLNFYF